FVAQGFEILGPTPIAEATVIPASMEPLLDPNQLDARTWLMSSFVLTQTRFGPGSGYTSNWCDAAHWGLVTAGRLAIEWEHDIEILAAGDVYFCAGGPPGHRLEAADPASTIDLTPIDAFATGRRVALWRRPSFELARPAGVKDPVAIAGLG
ncbi:MAG: hypothetical protein QOJ75_1128, partial [Chloroflexota bacterium]|nr:hypothetical protein [Chloroflexota bacterium]